MRKKLFTAARTIAAFIGKARGWITALLLSIWSFMGSTPVFASGNIGSSKLATGTEKLITDVTTWLLVAAPLVTVVAVIYYFIRKTVSDEMDHKKCCARKYA